MRLIHDPTYCIGCRACQVACQDGGHLPAGAMRMEIREQERERNGTLSVTYRLFTCLQCSEPYCAAACLQKALWREDGIVHVHTDRCVGCGRCEKVCPSGMIHTVSTDGGIRAVKCELCTGQTGDALCVRACPMGCIGIK